MTVRSTENAAALAERLAEHFPMSEFGPETAVVSAGYAVVVVLSEEGAASLLGRLETS